MKPRKIYLSSNFAREVASEQLNFFVEPRFPEFEVGQQFYFVAMNYRREPLPSELDGKIFEVTYVLQNVPGLEPGYAVIGFRKI